jgi:SAM-dependent methyltransferase
MDISDRNKIVQNYRRLFLEHGDGPAVGQWSAEGQRFRFEKLAQIANLRGARIVDIGCGIGDLFPFLISKYGEVTYTGVDIVPELVTYAAQKYPSATFVCTDVVAEPLDSTFDYGLISGVFNNEVENATGLLQQLVQVAFKMCSRGIAFNFTSNRVSRLDPGMAYHDPVDVFRFCIDNLSNKVTLSHHYERRDVSVFVYRDDSR